ncbi:MULTISPECIES: glycosyltransferase family 4 protein [unclassified Leptolyngbya]|uniref:glycosyltransferase family 4 protein n=1 Tax=unclassified Leptolyngbya TaxID=2650499 RepID=UPI0016822AEA|nr:MULTISPECIES: glycosyltransferase family 4 protein [unclassified Leptolyngbya]MBD1913573.1 glycosyltransferase family 4 protein [Leptolyngbya sp. FACHB-8]MBD2155856.1 glycosyltransferase family 4 protein [Leptolyngbya sp. FACHB-16]
MRILIYSYNYHPEPIGIAPLMTELAEGLASRGHTVRVVTGMPNYPERQVYQKYQGKFYCTEEQNGVTIQRSYVWIRPQLGLMTRILLDGSFSVTSLIQALRGWRPEVILLTVPPLPTCVPAALLRLIYKCPVVISLQDILPEAAVKLGILSNKWAIRLFELLERFAYRTASAIGVISDGFIENLMGKGVPRDKMHCIPNWVDVNFIRPQVRDPNPFRIKHQLTGKFVVLYSGNIALTQGMETVIRAAKLLQDVPNIVFVIAGEAKARQRLQTICEECQTNNVMLLPFEPRENLPQMLAAADVSLVVQKRNVIAFNMPSKVQLLLASGRPIIASVPLNGMAARAVSKSQGGMVLPPEQPDLLADAILRLYHNPAEAEAMGVQGRHYAIQHYSLEQALDSYESLFTKLVGKPPAVEPPTLRPEEVTTGH